MSLLMAPDPRESGWRADAALVYRSLRDHGDATALVLAETLFPTPLEAPATTQAAVRKRSLRRVFDAIVWMRHHGVLIRALPRDTGTLFTLSRPEDVGASPAVLPSAPLRPPVEEDLWHASR